MSVPCNFTPKDFACLTAQAGFNLPVSPSTADQLEVHTCGIPSNSWCLVPVLSPIGFVPEKMRCWISGQTFFLGQ